MNATDTARKKFRDLLRELFQFENADLDFGIYRIMNHKRDVIEAFIENDLEESIVKQVDSALSDRDKRRTARLKASVAEVKKILGENALDADGNLKEPFHDTAPGKEYLDAQELAANFLSKEQVEENAFSHLYAFFSRYYEEGDFVSKRRYSGNQRYAIPYSGEEVHLTWANRDQYYIKTGERFSHYAFHHGHCTVNFELRDADVEQDNRKGASRFFIPLAEKVSCTDEQIIVPFVFRPLSESEKKEFADSNGNGNGNGNAAQEAILHARLPDIGEKLDNQAKQILLAHVGDDGEEKLTLLEKHIRRYVRRNTADYFIHKDLQGFLTQELDYYIKNEVLHLDDLSQAGEFAADGRFHLMQVVRKIGIRIILFLTQIENFQKQLFEKKKFVIDTHYCVALGRIEDKSLRKMIAGNAKQWAEWSAMSGEKLSGEKQRENFLRDNPTLMVDTRHFDAGFQDNLLAQFADIDGDCDGVLLSGENFQGLNLLADKYRESVKCVYIDPPYNTDASAILYKNNYKHSSWLSLMENRLAKAKALMSENGILCCAIDDEEMWRLRNLMQDTFENELGIAPVRSNPVGRKSTGKFSPTHEYAFFYGKPDAIPGVLPKTEKELQRYQFSDAIGPFAWINLIRQGSGDRREDVPTMFYPIYVGKDNSLRIPKMEWDDDVREYKILEKPKVGETVVWPIREQSGQSIEKRWHRGWERVASKISEYRARRDNNGEVSIDFKARMDENAMPRSWWNSTKYSSASGTNALKSIFPDVKFDFPKSVDLVKHCLLAAGANESDVHTLDFFAGSGTTGHAVINLNREDGGRRKFILMEMGEYFDSVLLPRLKRIAWTPQWKDGKPKRAATAEETDRAPRMFKYQRMETYEDALENIAFDNTDTRQTALEFSDYLLSYMLQWETRCSKTFLNTKELQAPFDYKLRLRRNGDFSEARIDVPETFNYLLGLHVQTRKIHTDGNRRYLVYTGLAQNRQTTVIWRNTKNWKTSDFERDRDFVANKKLTTGADSVYANNTSLIPRAASIDVLFKKRLFGEEE